MLGESGGFCPTVFSFGLRVQVDVVEWEVAVWIEKCEWRVMEALKERDELEVVGLMAQLEWEVRGGVVGLEERFEWEVMEVVVGWTKHLEWRDGRVAESQ